MWWRRKRQTEPIQNTQRSASSAALDPPATVPPGQQTKRGFRWIRGRRYVEGTTYIGPKDASTDQFLDFQHFLVRRMLGGNHLAPLWQPATILDAGCGTGRWAVEMAAEFPDARVIGLDLVLPENTSAMLASLGVRSANVSFVEADLLQGVPFPDGMFDYVHFRFMYDELPAARWPDILRELVRVTRPGGWVECMEPGVAVYDPGPAYLLTNTWVADLCRQRGVDPDLGPQLKTLLHNAGLVQVSECVIPSFPDLTLTRERRLWQTQSLGVLEGVFRDAIIEAEIVSPADYDAALRALRAEFEQGKHANSDLVYVVFGQRLPLAGL